MYIQTLFKKHQRLNEPFLFTWLLANTSDSFNNLELRIYKYSNEYLLCFFFYWQTEKKNCIGPIKSFFSFQILKLRKIWEKIWGVQDSMGDSNTEECVWKLFKKRKKNFFSGSYSRWKGFCCCVSLWLQGDNN